LFYYFFSRSVTIYVICIVAKIFYKIYKSPEEIDVQSLQKILKAAAALDATFSKAARTKSRS